MNFIEIIVLSLGLAMDATAVSMTNGLSDRKIKIMKALLIGLIFGVFQAVMPLLGYLLGNLFAELIQALDHWIALVLLGYLGGKMLYDGFKKGEEEEVKELSFKTLFNTSDEIDFSFKNLPSVLTRLSSGIPLR